MKNLVPIALIWVFVACNNSSAERVQASQQARIDSLVTALKDRDQADATKKRVKLEKEKENKIARGEMNHAINMDKPSFIPMSIGGITNVRFNFYNDSKYSLELVKFRVHYLRANGDEVHHEDILIHDVGPQSRKALTAPDFTPAGRSVTVTIESLHSKEIEFCFDGMENMPHHDDPFKCE